MKSIEIILLGVLFYCAIPICHAQENNQQKVIIVYDTIYIVDTIWIKRNIHIPHKLKKIVEYPNFINRNEKIEILPIWIVQKKTIIPKRVYWSIYGSYLKHKISLNNANINTASHPSLNVNMLADRGVSKIFIAEAGLNMGYSFVQGNYSYRDTTFLNANDDFLLNLISYLQRDYFYIGLSLSIKIDIPYVKPFAGIEFYNKFSSIIENQGWKYRYSWLGNSFIYGLEIKIVDQLAARMKIFNNSKLFTVSTQYQDLKTTISYTELSIGYRF